MSFMQSSLDFPGNCHAKDVYKIFAYDSYSDISEVVTKLSTLKTEEDWYCSLVDWKVQCMTLVDGNRSGK
jgi:hypothetical protein